MGGPIGPSGGQGEARSLLCGQSLLCDSRKLVTPHPRVTHEQSERWARWAIGAPTAQRGREGAERASRHSPVTGPSLPCHRGTGAFWASPPFGPNSPRTSISPRTRSAQRHYRFSPHSDAQPQPHR